jgi:hypothetical protein
MPSLGSLLRYLHTDGTDQVKDLVARSSEILPEGQPLLWSEELRQLACTIPACRDEVRNVRLVDLLRHPSDRSQSLDALALVVTRDGANIMLPGREFVVREGDVILFCGTRRARHLLNSTANNPYTLHYLVTGEDPPRGWVFQWLTRRRPEVPVTTNPP